jgi:bifunctional UDP-N-acetylglucosamine pyrophosphorylase/glucosamine-1-phosphate N-acetyltransferase
VQRSADVLAVVLAAGKGTRMGSDLPKVLHELDGKPLVSYPIEAARAAGAERVIVVVGHGGDEVRRRLVARFVQNAGECGWLHFVRQDRQLGTGHAVLCALPEIPDVTELVFILSGDVPLLQASSLTALASACATSSAGLALATFYPDDPTGYGRIVRDTAGRPIAIVEQRDATPEQLALTECNAGTYCVDARRLRRHLPGLGHDNDQGEMYLTDLVARLAGPQSEVATVSIAAHEAAGVNTPQQLAQLSRWRREL